MDELEVKKQDHGDPAIDCCIRLYVRMVKHTMYVESIHLHYKFVDPNEVKVHRMEHAEEAIEFDLGL